MFITDEEIYKRVLADSTLRNRVFFHLKKENIDALNKCIDRIEIVSELSKEAKKKEGITHKYVGDLLETLVKNLFSKSDYFKITQNVRTGSNEVDIVVTLTDEAISLKEKGIMPHWLPETFIVECKNYSGKVGVTFLGKFFSLLEVSNCHLGLFISTNGITGVKDDGVFTWTAASGFVKKMNLRYSILQPPTKLLPISLKEIKNTVNNDNGNIIGLIKKLNNNIELDVTSAINNIVPHENEGKL